MTILTIIGIALGLAMDAFAVAVISSSILKEVSSRQVFRLSFHFGLFQALMPILGWLAGSGIEGYIRAWDHWVAFGILSYIGGRTIYSGLRDCGHEAGLGDPTKGMQLVMLSTATSIDALAVGLSLALIHVDIWYPAFIIGCITLVVTATGMMIGKRVGQRFGRMIEIAGGIILICIGLKILIAHHVF